MVLDYHEFKIETAPPSVYYIPDFITEHEEAHISKNVYSVPKPKWTCLSNRRLQDYGGVPHKNGMLTEPIPSWLDIYMKKIDNLKVFAEKNANHVLINEYLPGQGIMPHSDGPLFYPTVTTINCSSHTVLEFQDNQNGTISKVCNLLLEPRSLLILQDDMYNLYLHSINEQDHDIISNDMVNLKYCTGKYVIGQRLDRSTRISVTIRNVPKVAKIKLWR
ncbi:uncharacterized protein CBL_07021 [Carabus blaptoides fortunei]